MFEILKNFSPAILQFGKNTDFLIGSHISVCLVTSLSQFFDDNIVIIISNNNNDDPPSLFKRCHFVHTLIYKYMYSRMDKWQWTSRSVLHIHRGAQSYYTYTVHECKYNSDNGEGGMASLIY